MSAVEVALPSLKLTSPARTSATACLDQAIVYTSALEQFDSGDKGAVFRARLESAIHAHVS